jgi:hypothetical protein
MSAVRIESVQSHFGSRASFFRYLSYSAHCFRDRPVNNTPKSQHDTDDADDM